MRRHAALVLAAIGSFTPLAHADDAARDLAPMSAQDAGQQAAVASFQHGMTLYDAGNFRDALAAFRESYQQVNSPNSRLYIARCLRELGQLGEAVTEYRGTIDEAARAHPANRYAPTAHAAQDELTALQRRVGELQLNAGALPSDAQVEVDGHPMSVSALAAPIPVSPGHVTVVVREAGHEPSQSMVEVTAGATASVNLAVGPASAGGTAQNTATVTTADTTSSAASTNTLWRPWFRTASYAALGVGIVGFIVFGAFTAVADNQYNSLVQMCGMGPCPPSQEGAISSGRTSDALADVGLAFGIAGVVVGGVLLYLSMRPHHEETAPAPSVQLGFGGTSISLRATF